MIRLIGIALVLILPTPAFAQQPQQITPSQVAVQIDSAIGQLAARAAVGFPVKLGSDKVRESNRENLL